MSEYDDLGDWSTELTRLAGSVRPTPKAGLLVRTGIRRRQRRRAALAVGSSAAVVAVVAGSTFALTRPSALEPAPAAPTTSELFSCDVDWRRPADPPPIDDLAEQQVTIDSIEATSWEGFSIHYVRPTHLGVVALIDGDLEAARAQLMQAGASYVFTWDPTMEQARVDATGQIQMATQSELNAVLHEITPIRFRVEGYAGTALWHDAGAVILMWRAPVPAEVAALEGVRADGVRVVVWPTTYSSRDISMARGRVMDAFRWGEVTEQWSTSGSCPDRSGVLIGIRPPLSAERRAELQEQLSRIAGMPVMVVEQEVSAM